MSSKIHTPAVLLSVALFLSSINAFGATWYVDPVNGSDACDGSSPFRVPDTPIGPVQTIEGILDTAGQYDIVVLMDGIYAGDWNTGQEVMYHIDNRRLYVTSANGPENCIMALGLPIHFSEPTNPSGLNTHFSGLTFIPDGQPDGTRFVLEGMSRVCFEGCVFRDFHPENPVSAVVRVLNSADPVFIDCLFNENKSQKIIDCMENSSIRIEDCSFIDNQNAVLSGSEPFRIINGLGSGEMTVRNTRIAGNESNAPLYAIYKDAFSSPDGSLTVDHCIIENNSSTSEYERPCVGIWCNNQADVQVRNTRIENLSVETVGPNYPSVAMIASMTPNLQVSQCQFSHNNVGLHLDLTGGYPYRMEIKDCQFLNNSYPLAMPGNPTIGAVSMNFESSDLELTIHNCTLQQNSTGITSRGYHAPDGSITISNCLITENELAGIALMSAQKVIRHCTLANNGGWGILAADAVIENSILRQEIDTPVQDNGNLVFNYCNIQGGWYGSGVGNIDEDPLFADPGYWNGYMLVPGSDYHLRSTAGRYDPLGDAWVQDEMDSPCIDAGNPADFAGEEPYGSGGRINMGCYGGTAQASKSDVCEGGLDGAGRMIGDLDHSCRVDLTDFAHLAADWLQSTQQVLPAP